MAIFGDVTRCHAIFRDFSRPLVISHARPDRLSVARLKEKRSYNSVSQKTSRVARVQLYLLLLAAAEWLVLGPRVRHSPSDCHEERSWLLPIAFSMAPWLQLVARSACSRPPAPLWRRFEPCVICLPNVSPVSFWSRPVVAKIAILRDLTRRDHGDVTRYLANSRELRGSCALTR